MFWPCETRTSTCRSFATISSGLYRFLAIAVLLDVKDIPQVGPLQWGWIMAFTAYILLGDTLLGGAPCVVAIGMGHELRNFRAKGVCPRRNPRLLPPPQGLDHPRKHASTPLKTSTRPCSHHPSHPQPATQPASSVELSAIRLLYGM